MEGHILAAALNHFGMKSQDATLPAILVEDFKSTQGKSIFHKGMEDMLKGLIILPIRPSEKTTELDSGSDDVFMYACEVLSLTLLKAEFDDASRKGHLLSPEAMTTLIDVLISI